MAAAGLADRSGDAAAVGPASRPAPTYGPAEEALARRAARLVPLAEELPPAREGEWRHDHHEPGQTFRQYVAAWPVVPAAGHDTIYIQPLGEFGGPHRRILDRAGEFLGIYYAAKVKVLPELPLSLVPAGARRVLPAGGIMQIRTGYVLERVLLPRMPEDAFCMIGLTASDLWPGDEWDFVLGSASPTKRVGIWSLYRLGDPSAGKDQYRSALLRTLKTASHEVGHMFGMLHCTAYRCNMCGTDSLADRDAMPIAMCPECLAKLCLASQCDPAERFARLDRFYTDNGLDAQAAWCRKALAALGGERPTSIGTPAGRPGASRPPEPPATMPASRPAVRPAGGGERLIGAAGST
jgi:archaemetzincin